jgi:hypothetical protein
MPGGSFDLPPRVRGCLNGGEGTPALPVALTLLLFVIVGVLSLSSCSLLTSKEYDRLVYEL